MLINKAFTKRFIEIKKIFFYYKNQFFAFIVKTTKVTNFFNVMKLLPLTKLHIFLLFKIYLAPTFKFNQAENFIFEANFHVQYMQRKKFLLLKRK